MVASDGTVSLPDLPEGPPLGLGGLPFESAELELAEGSLLALYTDGLVEARGLDLDLGLARLREALSGPGGSLQETCTAVQEALLPDHPPDDVALLLARTRVLAPEQVASWELPAEPSAASRARDLTEATLTGWGLEELAFTAELVVSELVTNAYRYGGGKPVTLRLIRDRSLICEVSDSSSTAPHLRRARTTDEGGRGLFLVAQLTDRWGTCYTRDGKTVWTEFPWPRQPRAGAGRVRERAGACSPCAGPSSPKAVRSAVVVPASAPAVTVVVVAVPMAVAVAAVPVAAVPAVPVAVIVVPATAACDVGDRVRGGCGRAVPAAPRRRHLPSEHRWRTPRRAASLSVLA